MMASHHFKNILLKEGISQGELARACGLTSASINKFANGKRTPSPVTAYKILNALNKFENISKQYQLKDLFPKMKPIE